MYRRAINGRETWGGGGYNSCWHLDVLTRNKPPIHARNPPYMPSVPGLYQVHVAVYLGHTRYMLEYTWGSYKVYVADYLRHFTMQFSTCFSIYEAVQSMMSGHIRPLEAKQISLLTDRNTNFKI